MVCLFDFDVWLVCLLLSLGFVGFGILLLVGGIAYFGFCLSSFFCMRLLWFGGWWVCWCFVLLVLGLLGGFFRVFRVGCIAVSLFYFNLVAFLLVWGCYFGF